MKNLLTCDINRLIYMSYASCQRCSEGRAAQSGSHPPPRTRTLARGRRTPGPGLVRLQAPSLSLSPAGSAAQTTCSGGGRQGVFYRQTFSPFSGEAANIRRFNRVDLERDRQPSGAVGPASWGRPWLTARRVGHERCGWSIVSIGWGRRNVSFRQKCITGRGLARGARGSVQLSEERANAHGDIAIHLGLSRGSRHEVTAAQAFVQRHATYVDFLSLQRASEQNRIGGDPSHQIGSSVPLARHGRNLSPGQACGVTLAQPGTPAQRHGCRASSQEPPGTPGVRPPSPGI